jgi:transcriptional regulator with XRE-family HTH domain
MTPARLIEMVRRRHGLTQDELARRAGTSQPVVSAYEHGHRDPTFRTLRKLIEAGGEQLIIGAKPHVPDVPPATTPEEHARRLVDVLSVVDALPSRPRGRRLVAPRLVSS